MGGGGNPKSATPVPAATVMLLREGARSPEVLMLERHAKSEFLPDLYVFPGGRVDPGDHELADRVGGIGPDEACARAHTVDAEQALGFYVAAIRETFEEAGVLLARRRGESAIVAGELVAEISRHRLAMQAGEHSFREIVEEHDLDLAADLLSVHGHWITPEIVPHRFDTLFFLAAAPADHRAAHDGVESSNHVWIRPEDALAQAGRKEHQMIFPQVANLETLSGFTSVAAALRASRERPVVPVTPRVVSEGSARKLVIPADAGYRVTEDALEMPGR
jgi:8-oxo-dGTP pyrophosphatase MutT (NUDIX family)